MLEPPDAIRPASVEAMDKPLGQSGPAKYLTLPPATSTTDRILAFLTIVVARQRFGCR